MKITIGRLVEASNVLQRLAQHRFPAGQHLAAYRLNKLRRAVEDELKFFQAERRRLVEEHGTLRRATLAELSMGADKDVWEVLPDSEQWVYFSIRLKELFGIEVEIEAATLALDMLASVELSAQDLEALGPFVESCRAETEPEAEAEAK